MKLKNILTNLALSTAAGLLMSNSGVAQTVKDYSGAGVLKGTYTTIAAAFAAGADGDSFVLSPHTFYESQLSRPDASRKSVLQGTISGKDTSTIDAKGNGMVMGFYGTIRDVVITGGGPMGADAGGGLSMSGKLAGSTTIRNNVSKNGIIVSFYYDCIICDNVKIINNTITDVSSGFNICGPVVIGNGSIIRDNVLISGNKGGNSGAIMLVPTINKGDTNKVKMAGGLVIEGNVRIEHNEGFKAGAIWLRNGYGFYLSISGGSISHNICKTPEWAAAISVDTFASSSAGAPYDSLSVPHISLNNVRIFNPMPDGSRTTEIRLYNRRSEHMPKPSIFMSNGCWWGENDTMGLIQKETGAILIMPNWAVTNWFCLPKSTSSTSVMSVMRLNTGAALPPNSLKGLEGKFFATAGTFSTPSSTITGANVVASDYTYPSSGTFAVTAVIDADTFRPTTKMLGIKEQGFEQVKIYPNPATDVINISGTTEGSIITVYSMQGAVVSSQETGDSNQVSGNSGQGSGGSVQGAGNSGQVTVMDVSKLAAGNYILKIRNKDGGEGSAKVAVE